MCKGKIRVRVIVNTTQTTSILPLVFSLQTVPPALSPLMYSFLILSILVTPNENHNIFNSATSISACCPFVSATVVNPYNIACYLNLLCPNSCSLVRNASTRERHCCRSAALLMMLFHVRPQSYASFSIVICQVNFCHRSFINH